MMDRFSPDQIDRELGEWLRNESATRAPGHLVEEVFARTTRTRQASRWWPPHGDFLQDAVRLVRPTIEPRLGTRGEGSRPWQRLSAVVGAVAIVMAVVLISVSLRRQLVGQGATPSPSPSPSASATPFVRPTIPVTPPPTPVATTLGGLAARSLVLGGDAAPIAVTEAFGSIWVADIHADDVRRFDPATMAEIARIDVPSAAWFAVADNALWVTSQTDTGVSRIDPATNTVVAHVGDVPPCSAPVVAFGSLWQSACDANVILRIDPARNAIVDTVPADGHIMLVLAGKQLVTLGPQGLARLDVNKRTFTSITAPDAVGADFIASDGTTVWVHTSVGVARIDPTNGRSIAVFPLNAPAAISFSGGHAWLTAGDQGVLEIDMATNKVTRTIPLVPSPLVPIEAGGALWVTDFDNSRLWRIEL